MALSLQDSKAALERHRNDETHRKVFAQAEELETLMQQLEGSEQKLQHLSA